MSEAGQEVLAEARNAISDLKAHGEPLGAIFEALMHFSRSQAEALAVTTKKVRDTAKRLEELEDRLTVPYEPPKDHLRLAPTPAMIQETMRRNARRGRVGRAAKASGYGIDEWVEWCEKHGHDSTKHIKTERSPKRPKSDQRQTEISGVSSSSSSGSSAKHSPRVRKKAKKDAPKGSQDGHQPPEKEPKA